MKNCKLVPDSEHKNLMPIIGLKKTANIKTKYMTIDEIIKSINDIPYYKEVIDDYDNNIDDWSVYKTVLNYAEQLSNNRNKFENLDPIIVIDGKLHDGAHRISAIYLLKERLEKTNICWRNTLLPVIFASRDDIEIS